MVADAGDVAIEGGFLDCQNPVPNAGITTPDGQSANPPGPVISHIGPGALTLSDLRIHKGNAAAANATYAQGGGVRSASSAALTIYRSNLVENSAVIGGGLAVIGAQDQVKPVTLVRVNVSSNAAQQMGGGVFARWATLAFVGDGPSLVWGNHADSSHIDHGGGGIYAADSGVSVNFTATPGLPFLNGNWTLGSGGGIYFGTFTPGSRGLAMRSNDTRVPIGVVENMAQGFGGAFYLRATAAGSTPNWVNAFLTNADVSDNRAPRGSAVYLYANGSNQTQRVSMNFEAPAPNEPQCPYTSRCNRISGNTGPGAAVELEKAGTGYVDFHMRRGFLVDNLSLNQGGLVWGDGVVTVDNSVIAGNDPGVAAMFDIVGSVTIQNSTLADNLRVAPAVVRLNTASDSVRLYNSIVFQPGVPVQHIPAGATSLLRNLLLGSGHGLADLTTYNFQITGDPMFVAAGQGDYRIRLGSPAMNRWGPGNGVAANPVDLLGHLRPAPGDGSIAYDFGAFEYGAVRDHIYTDGFQEPGWE